MTRPILALGGLAAVAVLAVGGLGFINRQGGVGSVPTPSPTAAPTATPTATPVQTPTPVHEGMLPPGTYIEHPLPAPDAALAVTFTLPATWDAIGEPTGNSLLPVSSDNDPGGTAIQFVDVTYVNRDACHWKGTEGDIDLGPTVDDLVQALQQQTALEASEPVEVTLGGYSGKRIDVVAPTEPFPDPISADAPSCDEGRMRLWGNTAYEDGGIYMQGPANRWRANILDVEGTRLVVVAQDYPQTSAADRAELDAILDSMIIAP